MKREYDCVLELPLCVKACSRSQNVPSCVRMPVACSGASVGSISFYQVPYSDSEFRVARISGALQRERGAGVAQQPCFWHVWERGPAGEAWGDLAEV